MRPFTQQKFDDSQKATCSDSEMPVFFFCNEACGSAKTNWLCRLWIVFYCICILTLLWLRSTCNALCGQLKMCSHHECYIDAEKITMFPISIRNRLQEQDVCILSKYMSFARRLPWDRDDIVKGPMIQCHWCKEWYHKKCCRIDIKLYNKSTA